ncbi:MAG: hypothetical protein K6G69_11455 [Lachnospiraceae bacterium]|nr:hypothetical protein [Lachnospiraceae bacterium]
MARRMTKRERTRQIYIRCGILFVLLLGVFIALYIALDRSGKKEVDLNEYVHITMTGFNGEGELSASVDVMENYEAFFSTVNVEFSKKTGLSNGDEVTITYSYDKNVAKTYNLRIKASEQRFVVKGLIDPVSLGPDELFNGVEVAFEGIAPLVTATVRSDNDYSDFVTYEIVDPKDYYDIGDTVKVRAVYSDEDMQERNYLAQTGSDLCIKDFTVEDVDRYITNVDDITDEMMASLNKEALSLFSDANEYGMRIFCDAGLMPVYVNKKTTFVWNDPTHISSYLNVLKEENYGKSGTHVNDIKLCYESVISQANGVACNAEVVVRFTDIVLKADGSVELNLDSGEIISADRRDSHIKAIVQNKIDDDYEAVRM